MWAALIIGGLYFPIPCFIGGAIVVLANLPRDILCIAQRFIDNYNTCTREEALQWEQEDRILYNDPTLRVDYGQYSTLADKPTEKAQKKSDRFYTVAHSVRRKI